MVTSVENPLKDEFAYAHHPLWIRNPWDYSLEEDNGEKIIEDIIFKIKDIRNA